MQAYRLYLRLYSRNLESRSQTALVIQLAIDYLSERNMAAVRRLRVIGKMILASEPMAKIGADAQELEQLLCARSESR